MSRGEWQTRGQPLHVVSLHSLPGRQMSDSLIYMTVCACVDLDEGARRKVSKCLRGVLGMLFHGILPFVALFKGPGVCEESGGAGGAYVRAKV